MELFKLFGSILIDDKEAIDSLNKVDNKGKSTGQKFADVAKKGALIGAAVIGGTVAAGGALLGMATKTAEATDRVDKLSQKIGLSREGFQEWDFIMSQSGGSVEQLQMGFKTMVNAVDQAIDGTGKGAESFEKLGVSIKDASGNVKDQETIFNESVIALQGMEEGTEKAKLANDLFGRSGAEMMPLLNGASGSIEEMKQKAHDLGLVLDDETVNAGVVFTDTMDQLKRSMGAVVTKIGTKVMPIVQQALDWIIAHMPQIQAVASVVFGAIGNFVKIAANVFTTHFLPVIQSVISWVSANMPQIKAVTSAVFTAVGAVLQVAVGIFRNVLIPAFAAVVGWVQANWPQIRTVITTVMTIVAVAVGSAIAIIKGAFNGLSFVVGLVRGIFNGVKSAMEGPINKAKEIIRGAVNAIKGFFNFSISWPKIPMPKFNINPSGWKIGDLLKGSIPTLGVGWHAKGGVFESPTLLNGANGSLHGVGEAGPEAILPLNDKTYAGIGKGIANQLASMLKPQETVVKDNSNNNRPIILQIDGKTFAEITGDYFGTEGATRINNIERGLA